MKVNISQAKSKLSALIEMARAGEEIVIARAGKPVARITSIAVADEAGSGVRFGGVKTEKLKLAADFHAPMQDEELLADCQCTSKRAAR